MPFALRDHRDDIWEEVDSLPKDSFVYPGILDGDFKEEIKIMAYVF